ncbi:hypothetical protein ACQZ6A_18170 [Agrobacterium vitis]
MNDYVWLWDILNWVRGFLQPILDWLLKLDSKDLITYLGLLITFSFSCLNFRRTSQALAGTRANNRAARFETVHGPVLNEVVKEINEIGREISIGKNGFTDLVSAQAFFRDKIKLRIIKAEHMVVNEIFRIGTSDLAKDKLAWQEVSKSVVWEDVTSTLSIFLSAPQLDVAIANFVKLQKDLEKIVEAIEVVRSSENNI